MPMAGVGGVVWGGEVAARVLGGPPAGKRPVAAGYSVATPAIRGHREITASFDLREVLRVRFPRPCGGSGEQNRESSGARDAERLRVDSGFMHRPAAPAA